MTWLRTTEGADWRARARTVAFCLMWQEAEGAIWRWVTDAKGERVRLAVTCSRPDVVAAAGTPGAGWLQLLPVDRSGALSQDPPEMIAASDVIGPLPCVGRGPQVGAGTTTSITDRM